MSKRAYSGVSLPGLLVGVNREEDEFAAVLLQPLDIGLQTFNRLVSATVVNGNANCSRETLVQTCSLETHKFLAWLFRP
jgi:hypothetical protein